MRRQARAGILIAAAAITVAGAGLSGAQTAPAKPGFAADGTVQVPAFELPPSPLMSREAVERMKRRATDKPPVLAPGAGIVEARRRIDLLLAPAVEIMRARYAVDVIERPVAGVPARIVTPKSGATDKSRVLINLHGGGFAWCWEACSLLESLPIAATGGFEVISLNYRQAPEAVHPAGSEDVAAVYRELLKRYKPSQIGIYGCSAGGALAAQAGAWLPAHGLPQAGALGIFGSGGIRETWGDSHTIAAYVDGTFPPPPRAGGAPPKPPYRRYFDSADVKDPMVSPARHPDILAKFPPTLVITGTRSMDLSDAAFTHSQLIKAGVPGDLIVGEGMDHCYIYWANLPEAQDAYQAIVKFFRKHLG
jgi:acetyl esterase/lipase